jgi:hypothetical protein
MNCAVLAMADWVSPAVVGGVFTILGAVKVYGLCRGTVGGRGKPFFQYASGTCPAWIGRGWTGRLLRFGLPFLFLAIGLFNLVALALDLCAHNRGSSP